MFGAGWLQVGFKLDSKLIQAWFIFFYGGSIWFTFGAGVHSGWFMFGSGLARVCFSLVQVWLRFISGLV